VKRADFDQKPKYESVDFGFWICDFELFRSQSKITNPKSKMNARLDLTITAIAGKPFVPWLRRYLLKAHAVLNPQLRELSLALVGDTQMSELHEQFLGISGPTDVITFPLEQDRRGHATAGEVVVCVPEARRRSKAEGTDLRDELLLYALHGMLHLSGFDDTTPAKFKAIHREEDRILEIIGRGRVFAAKERPAMKKGRKRALKGARTKH
jgi:probable rRNA maturation factor